jgi:putative membrane protein
MLDGLDISWHWSPFTLAGLIILCFLYGLGVWRANKYAGNAPIKGYHILAFGTAIGLIALMLLTPFDMIARTQLFAAHMVQAVVLTTLCAPLLLAACPGAFWEPLLALPIVRSVLQTLTRPLVASILFNATFLLWHAPGIYNFAVVHGTVYHIELLSFLLTSLLNWWPLIGPVHEFRKLSYPMQMLYAFLDGQPVDIFAFLVVFTGVAFYTHYVIPPQFIQFGYSPVADQTVAGAFLLIPGLVDLVVMSPLFFRWLAQLEQKEKLADQQRIEEEEAERQEMEEEEEAARQELEMDEIDEMDAAFIEHLENHTVHQAHET